MRAVIYLAVLVVCVGVVARTSPGLLFMLFLAYPQVWFLVEAPRPGIVWTALVTLSSGVGLLLASREAGDSSTFAIISSAVGFVFSVLMGLWVHRVIEQSRQRAELIAELEATRSELAAAHHERGVAAERERLAREVHDTLAQGYASIVLLAPTAAGQIDGKPDSAKERIGLIEEVARENLAEARRVFAAFAPPALDGSSLLDALQRLADRFERETGTPVTVELPAQLTVDRDAEVVLLRSAQEALTNVRRHAAARHVTVRVAQDDAARLVVVDDGVGFDPVSAAGTGLAGLQSRVREGGGSLDVHSAVGRGTAVSISLPLQPAGRP